MDVLGNIGVEGLRVAIWIVAIVVGCAVAALQIWLPIAESWKAGWRQITLLVLRSVLSAVVAYLLACLAAVFYIMAHATDPRWSEGRDAHISAPKLSAGVPLFDGIVNALNGFATTVEGGVNDALAIKNAFLVSGEFMLMALWGLVVAVGVLIPTLLMGRYLGWWRARQVDDLVAENQLLKADIADARSQLGLLPYDPKKRN